MSFGLQMISSLTGIWAWLGIIGCIAQSGLFSGLNLAIFSLTQLHLQVMADSGDIDAGRVLALRKNSNQVLATIIWGNVSTNVLLTLLSNSVLAGLAAFFFSAIIITLLGEIAPQAYFSRNALQMTVRFLPFLNFYRLVLFPLAQPTGMLLDKWLGKEGITYPGERHIHALLARAATSGGDVGRLEAIGARNFFDLDDVLVTDEGEPIHAQSIISLPLKDRRCVLPEFKRHPDDPFLRLVDASGMRWIVVTDLDGEPAFVLDSHHFLRDALFNQLESNSSTYWHRPIIVRDMKTKLGDIIERWTVTPERPDDDVIHHDLILVWGAHRRIITGADLLGRLLRDIVTQDQAGNVSPAPLSKEAALK
jgi:metal transporter CNNM